MLPQILPTARTGSASDRGRRRHAADALAVRESPDGLGVAVADGIGDSPAAAAAARVAADTAAAHAAHEGAAAALLAAGAAVRGVERGDTVMVVAAAWPGRCEVAWVGDCRAYLWDGERLHRLTVDQTAAQAVRSAGGTPPRNWENVVLETVGKATAERLGRADVPGTAGRLALVSDGVHHELSDHVIAAVLERYPDPAAAARMLTDLALVGGAGDNASATVLDLPIGPPPSCAEGVPRGGCAEGARVVAPRPRGSTDPWMPAVPVAESA